jgi:hypothetical protein
MIQFEWSLSVLSIFQWVESAKFEFDREALSLSINFDREYVLSDEEMNEATDLLSFDVDKTIFSWDSVIFFSVINLWVEI